MQVLGNCKFYQRSLLIEVLSAVRNLTALCTEVSEVPYICFVQVVLSLVSSVAA